MPPSGRYRRAPILDTSSPAAYSVVLRGGEERPTLTAPQPASIELPVPACPELPDAVPVWCAAFFTDGNTAVKRIQSDSYPRLVAELFRAPRRRYLAACALVGEETGLAAALLAVDRFERPPLVRAYRKVAAFYRFAFIGEPQLELPLGRDRAGERARWEAFFRAEARRLAELDHIALPLLHAVVDQGRAAGRVAESLAVNLLGVRYGRFCLPRRLELLGRAVDPADVEGWLFTEEPDWERIVLDPRVRPDPPD